MAKSPPQLEPYRWQPGKSANPTGRPKNLLSQDQIAALIGKFAMLSVRDLRLLASDEATPSMHVVVANALIKAGTTGEYSILESLLTRSIGKVKDISEVHTHKHDATLAKEPKENVIELLRQLRGPKVEVGA